MIEAQTQRYNDSSNNVYNQFNSLVLDRAKTITEQLSPEQWGFSILLLLKRLEKNKETYPIEIQEFINEYVSDIYSVVGSYVRDSICRSLPGDLQVESAAKEVSKAVFEISSRFSPVVEEGEHQIRVITLDELVCSTS